MGEGWSASRVVGASIIWPLVVPLDDNAYWVPRACTTHLLAPGT